VLPLPALRHGGREHARPITITATVPAWLPYFHSLDSLLDAVKRDKPAAVANMLTLASHDLGKGENPYTLVGEATVAITLKPRDELTAARVQALQAELEAVRVESHRKQQAILDSISKLTGADERGGSVSAATYTPGRGPSTSSRSSANLWRRGVLDGGRHQGIQRGSADGHRCERPVHRHHRLRAGRLVNAT
jgi:hypothetical protein